MKKLLIFENQAVFNFNNLIGGEEVAKWRWEVYIPEYIIWNNFKGEKAFFELLSVVGHGQTRQEAIVNLIYQFTRLGVNIELDKYSWGNIISRDDR